MSENQVINQQQQFVKLETVDRLMHIPVIESGWNYVEQVYSKLKQSNNFVNWTFGQAEVSLHSALTTAMPAISLFQGPITTIDKILYQGLEKVEEKVPVITSPPDMLYNNTKQYVNDVMLKNIIIIDILKKIDLVKNIALENKYTGLAAEKLEEVLNVAEKYLNIYLPASPDDAEKEEVNQNTTATSSSEKALQTIQHFDKISRKLQRRLTQRTIAEAKALKEHSAEAINALMHIIKLVATEPKSALEKGQEIWSNLSKSEPENQGSPQTLDEVIFMLTRESARRVVHFVNYTSDIVKHLPNQMHSLTYKITHLLQDMVKEHAAQNLEEHKEEVNNLPEELKHTKSKNNPRTPQKKIIMKNKANGIEN